MKTRANNGLIGDAIIVALFVFLFAIPAFATGKPPKQDHRCQGGHNCNQGGELTVKLEQDVDIKAHVDATGIGIGKGGNSKSHSDADSKSISDADAKSFSGADSKSISDANSKSISEGGDANSKSVSEGGNADVEFVDLDLSSVDAGDYSTHSYKYEEAAASAAILYGQVCQDTTNLQGVSFGIGSQKQSVFCQRMSLAVGYLSAATMHECPEAESVLKGGAATIATPNPTTCQLDQRRAYLEGMNQMDTARDYLDSNEDGFVKKLWNKVW